MSSDRTLQPDEETQSLLRPTSSVRSSGKPLTFNAVCCALIACGGLCSFAALWTLVLYKVKAEVVDPGPPADCYDLPVLEGFPAVETVDVETADGLRLTLWRLPQAEPTHPVLIMHGLECSARDWFDGLGNVSLPYMLWDAGFDVWLGNNRGNFLSEGGVWNWSVLQMADFDLPAMISKVLADTRAPSLDYVGHSQGALQAFMHFSDNATTASKVSHFVALSPAVYLTVQAPVWNFFEHVSDVHGGLWWHMQVLFDGTFATYEEMMRDACAVVSVVGACQHTCAASMGGSWMEGHDGFAPTCGDKFKCIAAGTSSDNIMMFAEALRDGSFTASLADHGRPIDFAALPMDISLGVGTDDGLMQVADVETLRDQCGDAVVDFWTLEGAGHMDLVWGSDAPSKVFKPLVKRLQTQRKR